MSQVSRMCLFGVGLLSWLLGVGMTAIETTSRAQEVPLVTRQMALTAMRTLSDAREPACHHRRTARSVPSVQVQGQAPRTGPNRSASGLRDASNEPGPDSPC